MKKLNRQILSALLALLMFWNSCPISAFSADLDENVPETTQATEVLNTEPVVTEPKATEPKATEPKATEPKATEPKATEPKATEPVATEPKATEPEATEPEATEPEATEPEVTEPEVTEPEVTEPEVTEPEVTEPEVTEPEVTEPEATEPEVTEPEETEPADNCPYCDDTTAEDGEVLHTDDCNTNYAYNGAVDVNKYVKLSAAAKAHHILVSADPESADGVRFTYDEFGDGTIMHITGWYWDVETTALWYRVKLHTGAFPAGDEQRQWPAAAWILNRYTDPSVDYGNSLTVVYPCAACNEFNCTAEHIKCEICEAYDCTAEHIKCEICEAYDCTAEHIKCEICEAYDCTAEHIKCEICEAYDCTAEHIKCEICEAYDCTAEHIKCEICETYDCVAEHKLCELCQKYDCTIDHNAEPPRILMTSTGPKITSAYAVNIGKKATFNDYLSSSNLFISAEPKGESDWSSAQQIAFSEVKDLVVEISGVVEVTYKNAATYWYKVVAADGHTLPAAISAKPWIFQNFVGVDVDDTLIIQAAPENTCKCCDNCTGHEECQCGCDSCAFCEPENSCECGCENCTGVEGCECQCGNCVFCEVVIPELNDEPTGVTVYAESFPEGVTLSVSETDVTAQLAEFGVSAEKQVFGLDISLLDADNAVTQPDGTVLVKIPVDVAVGTKIGILHTHGDKTTYMGLTRVLPDGTVLLETSGFSEFAGFTVDFYYDGVEFSIEGMTSILLSELFAALNIDEDATQATSVKFTDNSLVGVSQEGNDWRLTSLEAFQTEETLAITFSDGRLIFIFVTDQKGGKESDGSGNTYRYYLLDSGPNWAYSNRGILVWYNNALAPGWGGGKQEITLVMTFPDGTEIRDTGTHFFQNGWSKCDLKFRSTGGYWFEITDWPYVNMTKEGNEYYSYSVAEKNGGTSYIYIQARNTLVKDWDMCTVRLEPKTAKSSEVEERTVQIYLNGVSYDSAKVRVPARDSSLHSHISYTDETISGSADIRVEFKNQSRYRYGGITLNQSTKTYRLDFYDYKYQLNYNVNGGNGSNWSDSAGPEAATSHTFTVTSTQPKRNGYKFLGWSESSSATSASYTSGSSITINGTQSSNGTTQTASKTLYAVWQAIPSVTIHHYKTGTSTKLADDTVVALPFGDSVTVSNYAKTIAGYTYASSSPATFTVGSNASANTATVYYNPIQYKVTYKYTGTVPANAPSVPAVQSYDYGTTVTVASAPSLVGYSFSGWSKTGSFAITANMEITGSWTPNTYKVTLDNQGATTAGTTAYWYIYKTTKVVNNETVYYWTDSACTTPLSKYKITPPTKTGYTFGGYYTGTNGTGTQYVRADGVCINNLYDKVTGDSTLYAHWIPEKYTIKFVDEGGNVLQSSEWEYGAIPAFNGEPPEKEDTVQYNYTFGGWTPTITPVTGEATYTVKFNSSVQTYKVQVSLNPDHVTYTGLDGFATAGRHLEKELPYGTTVNSVFTVKEGYCIQEILVDNVVQQDIQNGEVSFEVLGATLVEVKTAPIVYDLTWVYDNGDKDKVEKVAYGAEITKPSDPVRTGYDFDGWNPTIPATMPAKNLTFTATWSPVTYAITYNLDGGTNHSDNPATYTIETETFTLQDPTKAGYEFIGWTGTGISGDAVKNPSVAQGSTGKREYTAFWKANTYNLYYDVNYNDSTAVFCKTVTYDTKYGELPTVSRTGYTFDGWFTAPKGGTKVEIDTTYQIAADSTIYAHWTVKNYPVTFKHCAHESATVLKSETKNLTYGTTFSVQNHKISIAGYTFDSCSPAEYTVNADEDGQTVVLYYKENQVTINYVSVAVGTDGNGNPIYGGTVIPESETVRILTGEAAGATATAMDGYSFAGWYATADCSGEPLSTTEELKPAKNAQGYYESATYYAKFVKTVYTVTFKTDADTVYSTADYTMGNTVTLVKPEKTGYICVGWYRDADNDGEIDENEDDTLYNDQTPFTMPSEDVTLIAQWERKVFTITFKDDKGTEFETMRKNVPYGETVKIPDDPAKANARFQGWCYDEDGDDTVDHVYKAGDQFEMPENDVTLTARWIYAEKLTISVNGDSNEMFFFNVVGTAENVNLRVSVAGGSKVTIEGLFSDTYTVSELNNWSWTRGIKAVTPTAGTVTMSATDEELAYTVEFEMQDSSTCWLHDEGHN